MRVNRSLQEPSARRKNFVAGVVLGFVGSIFIFKYGARHSALLGLTAVLYLPVFLLAVGWISGHRTKIRSDISRKTNLYLLALVTLISAVLVMTLPEKSDVSRLAAISGWLKNFLDGHFPYGISVNPSPLPVLFFLALPFYLVGNPGLLEVAGVLFLGIAVLRMNRDDTRRASAQLLTLLLLPSTYYELVTRSELFFNVSLVILVLMLADEAVMPGKTDLKFFGIAVAMGLALSTRTVVGLAYASFVVFKFRSGNFKNGLRFSFVVMLTFCLTFVPFIIWNFHEFVLDGPFAVQFGYVSFPVMMVSLGMAAIVGFVSEGIEEVFYLSGLLVFGLVLWAFIQRSVLIGLADAFFGSRFDVGYFILCVPYLVLSIGDRLTPVVPAHPGRQAPPAGT